MMRWLAYNPIVAALVFLTAALCINAALVGAASSNRAKTAAENVGLKHVRVESRSWAWGTLSGCSTDDNVQFRVSGVGSDGRRRYLHVCANAPLGGYTVRS